MPIYEFKCRDCGAVTERLVKTMDRGSFCTCRNCGGNSMERIMSRTAVPAGRSFTGGPAAECAPDCGYGAGGGAGAVSWPVNKDYIKIKGQQ